MDRVHCFEPIVFSDSKVLVMGTLPGKESLETGFYYAKKGNYFWKFLSDYARMDIPKTKQDKLNLLKITKVAIWDIYESGIRESSRDNAIKDGKLNDIPRFLKEHPNITKVGIAGKKGWKIVNKEFPFINAIYLPSTSGSNGAKWTLTDKTRTGWWNGENLWRNKSMIGLPTSCNDDMQFLPRSRKFVLCDKIEIYAIMLQIIHLTVYYKI
jgi:hypoxanthine-DNA glycosylase